MVIAHPIAAGFLFSLPTYVLLRAMAVLSVGETRLRTEDRFFLP